MKKFFLLMLLSVTSIILIGCGQNGEQDEGETEAEGSGNNDGNEEIVLRLAENQPDNNPVTIAMFEFSELVEEKSNGEVSIEVYPNAQLGEESDNIDQVRSGELDMARVNSVPVAEIVDDLGVFTLPYIFTDQDHKYRVLDGEIGDVVNESLEESNFKNFGYLEAGSRNFYTTNTPIESVDDMEGMQIRVQPSEISNRMIELLGAVPTPMDYGEVFSSLQTGVIDGAENDFVSFYTSGHYEVAPYYTLDAHLSPPAILLMNLDTWNELSDEHQSIISEAANEAIEFQREEMNKSQDESRAEVEEAGVEIFEVDIEEFQEAVEPIYEEFPEQEELIERVRNE